MDLFDAAKARMEADDAITRVEHGCDPVWIELATRVVQRLARELPEFSTDQVWMELQEHVVREPRALGAVMRAAARYGWVRNSGRYVKSSRTACHSRPVPLWSSRIYRGAAA